MDSFEIELIEVIKRYGKVLALNNLNLKIKMGEFFTLLGPSGAGKSTTLRTILGFDQPDSGDIIIRGMKVNDIPPHKRNIGMVFQNYALFPHLTIFENIAFPLKMRGKNHSQIQDSVYSMLDLVDLQGYENRYPTQLSGGQKQRVALARALIFKPTILLMDEPLGALDRQLRNKMRMEIKKIQKKLQITVIYVTHDQEEALTLSDRMSVIKDGIIEQVGSPLEIYKYPKNLFVASFIGDTNLLEGTISKIESDYAIADIASNFKIQVPMNNLNLQLYQRIEISIRPENIKILSNTNRGFSGEVTDISYLGNIQNIIININGIMLKIFCLDVEEVNIGDIITISIAPEDCVIFCDNS